MSSSRSKPPYSSAETGGGLLSRRRRARLLAGRECRLDVAYEWRRWDVRWLDQGRFVEQESALPVAIAGLPAEEIPFEAGSTCFAELAEQRWQRGPIAEPVPVLECAHPPLRDKRAVEELILDFAVHLDGISGRQSCRPIKHVLHRPERARARPEGDHPPVRDHVDEQGFLDLAGVMVKPVPPAVFPETPVRLSS